MTAPAQDPRTLLGVLATQAAAAVAPRVGDQIVVWTEYLLDAVNNKLMPYVPDEAKGAVAAAMQFVRSNEAVLGKTSMSSFTALVTHLALGHNDAAKALWIEQAVSDADVLAQLRADNDAAQAHALARETAYDRIEEDLIAVVPTLLPLLVKLLPFAIAA